jgi:hypothetical protein
MKEQVDQLSLQVGSKADDEVSYTHKNPSTPPSTKSPLNPPFNKGGKGGLSRGNGDSQEQVKHLKNQDELIPMGEVAARDQEERFTGF